jgi:hypothetical protein
VHTPAPVVVLDVPMGHSVHTTPLVAAAYPRMQIQDEIALVPAFDCVPAGHDMQLFTSLDVTVVE